MSTIQPLYKTIGELLSGRKFSIDEYQREYKWDRGNIVELVNDLENKFFSSYQKGHETKAVAAYDGYFLGSIIVSRRKTDEGERLYLVDGQQRVTSLTLLLIHLYHEAAARGLTLGAKLEPLIFSDSFGEKAFNLDIPERYPVIQALFHQTPFSPESHDESLQTMWARYQDIEGEEVGDDLGEALPHFIYWLTSKVGLIEISTDNDSDAYAIFETMNDRGKPLSPVDMLKAYLLAPITDPDRRKVTNQVWKREIFGLISWGGKADGERDLNFFKAWFRAQFAETIRERKEGSVDRDWELVGSAFHRWARDNHERLNWGKTAENDRLVNQELPFFARAYKFILDAQSKYSSGLEAVYYNAHNDFTWQPTVLMAPLVPGDSEDVVKAKVALMADYLDIWIMRRVVNYVRVSYSSVSYAMFLLCRDARRKSLAELSTLLQSKLEEDDVQFEGSPSRGRLGIADFGLNQFSRRYIYHLLARITSFLESQSGKGDRFPFLVDREQPNPFDIEHIWPDRWDSFREFFAEEGSFREARNRIGGLLLLPADVNRSLQDKLFADKAPHYAKQNLWAGSLTPFSYQHEPQFLAFRDRTASPFRAYEGVFGPAEQAERTQLVLVLCRLIWSPERLRRGQV